MRLKAQESWFASFWKVSLGLFVLTLLLLPIGVEATSNNTGVTNTGSFINAGLAAEFTSLWNQAPCNQNSLTQSAVHEAPSHTFSWWVDDNAKTLGATAYASGQWLGYSTQIISFLNNNILGGYSTKKCVNVVPHIKTGSGNNINLWDNMYNFSGNPVSGGSTHPFQIQDAYNPGLAMAYFTADHASVGGYDIAINTGLTNIIQNGGFDGGGSGASCPQSPWAAKTPASAAGSGAICAYSQTYYQSSPNSLILSGSPSAGCPGCSEQVYDALPVAVQYATSAYKNITWWGTAMQAQAVSYNVFVNYTSGASQVFAESDTFSASPGTYTLHNIPGSSLTGGLTVKEIGFEIGATNLQVSIDNAATSVVGASPSFTTQLTGKGAVYMNETLTFQSVVLTFSYELWPHSTYVLPVFTAKNTGGSGVQVQLLPAFNGLDTIGSGYAWMYVPGCGWIRPNQAQQSITVADVNYNGGFTNAYQCPTVGNLAATWGGIGSDWFLIGVHGVPDWIGNDGIFVAVPQQNLQNGFGGSNMQLVDVQNTIAAGSSGFGNGRYFHWVQMVFNDNSLAAGAKDSVALSEFYAISYDWTNPMLYDNFMGQGSASFGLGLGLPGWLMSGNDWSLSYYTGEIANELAVYAYLTGGFSSPSYSLAYSTWNYYYRLINAQTNGTYTDSLSRMINATVTMSRISGGTNQTYISAVQKLANKLEKDQEIRPSYQPNTSNPNEVDYFHHVTSCCQTVNTVNTFGQIFNRTTTLGTGYVASGASVSLTLFRTVSLGTTYMKGTQTITFYMNSNSAGSSGTYQACLEYITTAGATVSIPGCPAANMITLPAGSGSPPFTAYSFSYSITNTSIPAGATLAVALTATDAGHTVYVLWDSTNGPSNIQLNYYINSHPWQWGCTIPVPVSTSATALPQTQPFYLDTDAACGYGLQTAFVFNGNNTDATRANLAHTKLRSGYQPLGYKALTTPAGAASWTTYWRLYSYANGTYADTDYSTYKAMLVTMYSAYVNSNQTLMNLAMSRVWDRMVVNSTYVRFNTGEFLGSGNHEFNSETQPWGLITLISYQGNLVKTGCGGNYAPFMGFPTEQIYLKTFSGVKTGSSSCQITYTFYNPSTTTPYHVNLYNSLAGGYVTSVTWNGVNTPYTTNSIKTIPLNGSVYSTETLVQGRVVGTWVINTNTNPISFCAGGPSNCNIQFNILPHMIDVTILVLLYELPAAALATKLRLMGIMLWFTLCTVFLLGSGFLSATNAGWFAALMFMSIIWAAMQVFGMSEGTPIEPDYMLEDSDVE